MRGIQIAWTLSCLLAAGLVFSSAKTSAAPGGLNPSEGPLPDASVLLNRIVARGHLVFENPESPSYTYDKRSLEESLNGDGGVKESTVKWYRVRVIQGKSVSKLVRIEGRDLTQKELHEEDRREGEFRRRLEDSDAREGDDPKDSKIFSESELNRRFEFEVLRREFVQDRASLVMTFRPKDGSGDGRNLRDKVMAQIAGTLWVDEADAEVSRLEVSLKDPVVFGWFGIGGALHQFQLKFERTRMRDGLWVTLKSVFSLRSRILFKTVNLRRSEQSSGFLRQ